MEAFLVQATKWICLEKQQIPKSMEYAEVKLMPIKLKERIRKKNLGDSLGIAFLNNGIGKLILKDEIKFPILGNRLYSVDAKCPDAINADYC